MEHYFYPAGEEEFFRQQWGWPHSGHHGHHQGHHGHFGHPHGYHPYGHWGYGFPVYGWPFGSWSSYGPWSGNWGQWN